VNQSPELDQLPTDAVVALLLDAEERVGPAVRVAAADIVTAAELCADRLRGDGRLIFVGAGSSGRIAAAEAAELPGTFGLDRARVVHRLGGGDESTDDDEDDLSAAREDIAALALTGSDVVIAVAASGSTPYTLAVAQAARAQEAAVIAVVTVTGSPLAELATVTIAAVVGEEVLRGSTRLGAATAQKIVLNTLTTAAMTRYGRIHGDLMIDVVPANAKLRRRAAQIVSTITSASEQESTSALTACAGDARAAVLMLELGLTATQASERAKRNATLRAALTEADVPGR
jgi:N-acetylmuramic acid 6-phosphate etherase